MAISALQQLLVTDDISKDVDQFMQSQASSWFRRVFCKKLTREEAANYVRRQQDNNRSNWIRFHGIRAKIKRLQRLEEVATANQGSTMQLSIEDFLLISNYAKGAQ